MTMDVFTDKKITLIPSLLTFPLTNYMEKCYFKTRVLEVFVVDEATKIFDLCGLFYMLRPSEISIYKKGGKRNARNSEMV